MQVTQAHRSPRLGSRALMLLACWLAVGASPEAFQQAARLQRGDGRPGLAFRVIWFEREDPARDAAVTRFVFPIGCTYGSHELMGMYPVRGGAEVSEDEHGNWTMRYEAPLAVGPERPLLMGYVNAVELYSRAVLDVNPRYARLASGGTADVEEFLADDPILTLTDADLLALAEELRAGSESQLDLALATWARVHETLVYGRAARPNTAAEVLAGRKGQCGEYGKLTIALLRINGIPARGVWCLRAGNTGPSADDHAWAEAYLDGIGWCPIRPQEEPPEDHQFALGYHSYLVVCRPASGMDPYRSVEWENARVATGYRGAGFFADVPRGEQEESIRLFQAIADDDSAARARTHLRQTKKAHRAVQPMLYWALCASSDERVAAAAAEELVSICGEPDRRLSLDRFHGLSPDRVRQRIDQARESGR